ncbi:MAG TPA: ATP-binding protein [Actinomycetota bacterium]
MQRPDRARAVRQGGVAAGLLAAAGGSVVLAGWFTGNGDAAALLPGASLVGIPTASALIALGGALAAAGRSFKRLQFVLALVAVAIAVPVLLQAFGIRETGLGVFEIPRAGALGGRSPFPPWGACIVAALIAASVAADAVPRMPSRAAAWLATSGWIGLAILIVDRVALPLDAPATEFGASVGAIALLGIAAIGQQATVADRRGAFNALLIDGSVRGQLLRRFTLPIPLVTVPPLLVMTVILRLRIEDQELSYLLTRIGTATIAALIIVVAATGSRVAATTGRRLRALADTAARVAAGDTAALVEPPHPGTRLPDEFAHLARSMETMRTSLVHRDQTETFLREATRFVAGQEDLDSALSALRESTLGAAPVDLVGYGVTAGQDRVVGTGVSGAAIDYEGRQLPIDPEAMTILCRGEPFVLELGGTPPRTDAQRMVFDIGIRSMVVLPIVAGSAISDLVMFASYSSRAFPPAIVDLFDRLVRETAATLRTLSMLERERDATRRLTELDQLKNEFVGIVAHDLRSPMSVVAGFTDTMLSRWTEIPDDKKRSYIEIVSRTIRDMSELVGDVLQVARIESGEPAIAAEPFDLAELVHRTTSEIAETSVGRKLVVTGDAPVIVAGDPTRIWRVLTNLVSNALKFSPDDAPVEIDVSVNARFAHVAVRDHGPGIAPEDMGMLFQKFGRIPPPPGTDSPGGTGLGLYICKSIVEDHGGTIEVDTALGEGSTFQFSLPLIEVTKESEPG